MDASTTTSRSAEPADSSPTPASSWIGLAILILLGLLAWIDRGIVALMVDPIRRDLHISEFQFGLLQGLGFALFYALCGVPLGWAADRWSRRWLIFISTITWSLAAALCGAAQNFWQMLGARFGVASAKRVLRRLRSLSSATCSGAANSP